jgi:hypothetical protein
MNKSFLNGLRAPRVLALVMVACFTCLVVSSCTKDEVSSNTVQDGVEEILFPTSSFNGISMKRSPINGNYLVFESRKSFIEISDYVAKNLNSIEVENFSETLKSLGFVSRYEYELANDISFEDRHPDPAISLMVNQNGCFQLKDSLFRDEVQKNLYFIDATGNEKLLATKNRKTVLKSVSSCDPTITGDTDYDYERTYDYYNDELALRIDAWLRYTTPWMGLGSEKVALTTESSVEHQNSTVKTPTSAYHELYYVYDVDINGSRAINNGTTVQNPTARTSLTSTIISASSICFGAVYVTAKVRNADGEYVEVMLDLR